MIYFIEPKSWKDLVKIEESFPSYSFRGQSNNNWQLSTVFERQLDKANWAHSVNREEWILKQFKRRAHNVINSPPQNDEDIEWLSIIQHYGGPTRFLDFTHSFFIALFFACENIKIDGAVWFINRFELFHQNVGWSVDENIWDVQVKSNKFATEFICSNTDDAGVLAVEPFRLNERMSLQQGVFMMPTDITESFMYNLSSQFIIKTDEYKQIVAKEVLSEKVNVGKIIIKAQWKKEIKSWLDNFNINSATLFPGLDGFAKALVNHLIY